MTDGCGVSGRERQVDHEKRVGCSTACRELDLKLPEELRRTGTRAFGRFAEMPCASSALPS